jgi:hypothetical protein
MEEKTKLSPEDINDKTIVENFIKATNGATGNVWTIHTECPFGLFNSMMMELIDQNFVDIEELEVEKWFSLATKFHNGNFPQLNTIEKVKSFTAQIASRKYTI